MFDHEAETESSTPTLTPVAQIPVNLQWPALLRHISTQSYKIQNFLKNCCRELRLMAKFWN